MKSTKLVQRAQQGFTLIELMVVVAIIGILAAVALPAYQDFQVKSRVSEVLGAMSACKTTVTEFYDSNNGWTNNAGQAINAIDAASPLCGVANPPMSKYVQNITIMNATGSIQSAITGVLGGSTAANQTIQMDPNIANGRIQSWTCGVAAGTTVPAKYRPGTCQG